MYRQGLVKLPNLNLDILLTVHLSIIYFLYFQLDTLFFVYVQYLLSSFLYMLQASQAHHQEV